MTTGLGFISAKNGHWVSIAHIEAFERVPFSTPPEWAANACLVSGRKVELVTRSTQKEIDDYLLEVVAKLTNTPIIKEETQ